ILPLQSIDPRSAYIFWFAQKSESSELLLGDMPLESRYGYVFSKALDQQAYHTIAHELAHGVFSLRHTFSKDYAITQGSTRNLMDYPTAKTTNATELKKYQWDALHDPKKLIAPWMQNEEEGAYVWTFWNKKHTLLFNHIYDYHKTSNQYYLDKIKKSTTDNIALEYNTKSLYKDEQEFIKN